MMLLFSKSREANKRPKRSVRTLLALAALIAFFGLWSSTGCLYQPATFQIHNFNSCSSTGGATARPTSGQLDVGIANGYILQFGLLNTLGMTSDPAQFRPETNYIQVNEAKVWFEYPPNFSLNGGGAALYPESAPKLDKVHFRIAPTTPVDFAGQQQQGAGAGAGGVQLAASNLPHSIVPIETLQLWKNAAELKAAPGLFKVYAHVSFTGTTVTGSVLSTQEITIAIDVCLDCMNGRKIPAGGFITCSSVVEPVAAGGGGGGAGGGGGGNALCLGNDGVCLGAPQNQP